MIRTMNRLADRMVSAVAPKVTARAATSCKRYFCYCRGLSLYTRNVCLTEGQPYEGPCEYVGKGC